MKFTNQRFVVAGIVGAITVTGAIATSATSHAAASASGGNTAAASTRITAHIAPGTCSASDIARHRQVSVVTVQLPSNSGTYDTSASVSNRPDSLGGSAPDDMVWYTNGDLGTLAASKTVTTRLSWPASVTHGYFNAKASATEALGGDVKSFELGGAHGLHGYSTVC